MNLLYLVLFVAFGYFVWRRLLRYLHIFQQESYHPLRFLAWTYSTFAFDRRLTSVLLIFFFLNRADPASYAHTQVALTLIFLAFGWYETDPRKIAKKKLDMTQRATRIFYTAFALCLIAAFLIAEEKSIAPWIIAAQFPPLAIALANLLLMPAEVRIQRRIMRQASSKLADIAPDVIGITGSFGKTSVKHILGHILEMNAPTFFTPGSVNTLMGISRIINEKLLRGCRFFLVEMAAYGIGSIKKLCALTPPTFGIVTSLGEAHYERFKSLDAVARAKFELAQAVLSNPTGKMVVHESVLAQPYARDFVQTSRDKFIIVGPSVSADLQITGEEQTAGGLIVTVAAQGQTYELFAPLYGPTHAGNIAVSFAAAVALGIPPERAIAALRTVPQITHRLEVKPQAGGLTYIDDAFNSNPYGFAAALDILHLIGTEKGGRRILITPGMVELGQKHDQAHRELGAKAADTVDIAIVIRADRIPTFVEGFRQRNPQKSLLTVANLIEAQKWLRENGKAGDVYLIENDLPDNSEAKLSL